VLGNKVTFPHKSGRVASLERLQVNFRPARFIGSESKPPGRPERTPDSLRKRCADRRNYFSVACQVDEPKVTFQFTVGLRNMRPVPRVPEVTQSHGVVSVVLAGSSYEKLGWPFIFPSWLSRAKAEPFIVVMLSPSRPSH
jgi:hypothetical protein